jgi:hypothetical protein
VEKTNEKVLEIGTRRGNEAHHRFIPDIFFYDGQRYDDPGMLEETTSDKFITRMQEIRENWDRRAWDSHEHKYDLCPVTRRIILRAAPLWEEKPSQGDKYDVFICFASEDIALARMVFDYIVRNSNKTVFFSADLKTSVFVQAIYEALESANWLVAVGGSRRHLEKEWPKFEINAFHLLRLNGKKPNSQLLSYISGMHVAELPLPLTYYRSIPHNPENPEQSLRVALGFLEEGKTVV